MTSLRTHQDTYGTKGVSGYIHRQRRAAIGRLFEGLPLSDSGRLADFGCSNGYIIEHLQQSVLAGRDWQYTGFDHNEDLLEEGRKKHLPATEFFWIDLNTPTPTLDERFDIVTSFETMEHVGDCEAAVSNLYRACVPGGHVILGIPNEVGLPGLAKYLGRRLSRRDAYGDFFDDRSEWRYVVALLTGRRIDGFRKPVREGWGPHLGFDARVFEHHLMAEYVDARRCELLARAPTRGAFNILYVLRKG